MTLSLRNVELARRAGDQLASPGAAPTNEPADLAPRRSGAKRGPKPARGRLILLPAQFFDDPQTPLKMPERRLMLAVLADAVECFRKYGSASNPRQRALFADARRWLMARDTHQRRRRDAERRLSFEYICDVLDLCPEAIRDQLQRWEKQPPNLQP